MQDFNFTLPDDIYTPPLDSGSIFTPDKNTLPAPPETIPGHDSHPPDEWKFQDQAGPGFQDEIVEREPFESSEPEEQFVLDEEDHRRIIEAVQDDDRVRDELRGQRHTFIGSSLRNSPPKEGTNPVVEVLIYDYDRDTALLIRLDGIEDAEVQSIDEIPYQPTPTSNEVREAIELARDSEALSGRGVEEMEAGVLRDYSHIDHSTNRGKLSRDEAKEAVRVLEESDVSERITSNLGRTLGVPPVDLEDDTGRRRLDVRFSMPGERTPRFYALVDLSNREVIEAGPVE